MRKLLLYLTLFCLLTVLPAHGESLLSIGVDNPVIRPGQAVRITFRVPGTGTAHISLHRFADDQEALSVVAESLPVTEGDGSVYWNGTYQGVPAPQGPAFLVIRFQEETATVPVTVGLVYPMLMNVSAEKEVSPEHPLTLSFYASCAGVVSLTLEGAEYTTEIRSTCREGEQVLRIMPSQVRDGEAKGTLVLTDTLSTRSESVPLKFTLFGFDPQTETVLEGETVEGSGEDGSEESIPDGTGNVETGDWTAEADPSDSAGNVPAGETVMAEDPEGTVILEETVSADDLAGTVIQEGTVSADDLAETVSSEEPEAVTEENAPDSQRTGTVEDQEMTAEENLPDDRTAGTDAEMFPVVAEELSGNDLVIMEDEVAHDMDAGDREQLRYTPAYGSPYAGQDTSMNYWTLPMDIRNEEAVWEMLMQPITVLDNGKKNAQKTQVIIRAEPSESSAGVGVVTCISQGVHVLEKGNEWTLIECYSSSFHDSKVKIWNELVQGYVPTSYLRQTEPNQELAIVIDKLTQRLYLFRDGHLFTTLLVSTGLSNARQPYNETRSGEFLLLLPAVGEFRSDNLYCSMGIRFNDGDLLHEVPHLKTRDGGNDYSTTEGKLGTRASHGCIRVQRRTNAQGVNMKWLWDNRKKNMKMVIWEDWQGRQIPYPDDDFPVYYNPNGGSMYHSSETCNSAKGRVFTAFAYGELDSGNFAKLTRCTWCTPPLRKAEIDAINELHAPGGDHDPVLTAAREKTHAGEQ